MEVLEFFNKINPFHKRSKATNGDRTQDITEKQSDNNSGGTSTPAEQDKAAAAQAAIEKETKKEEIIEKIRAKATAAKKPDESLLGLMEKMLDDKIKTNEAIYETNKQQTDKFLTGKKISNDLRKEALDDLRKHKAAVEGKIANAQQQAKKNKVDQENAKTQTNLSEEEKNRIASLQTTTVDVLNDQLENAENDLQEKILDDAIEEYKCKINTATEAPDKVASITGSEGINAEILGSEAREQYTNSIKQQAQETAEATGESMLGILEEWSKTNKNENKKKLIEGVLTDHKAAVDARLNEIKTQSETFKNNRSAMSKKFEYEMEKAGDDPVLHDAYLQWQTEQIENIRNDATSPTTNTTTGEKAPKTRSAIEASFKEKLKESKEKKAEHALISAAFSQWRKEERKNIILSTSWDKIDAETEQAKKDKDELKYSVLRQYKSEIDETIEAVSKEATEKYKDLSEGTATHHLFMKKIQETNDEVKGKIFFESHEQYMTHQRELYKQTEEDEDVEKGINEILKNREPERKEIETKLNKAKAENADLNAQAALQAMLEAYNKKTQEMIQAETTRRIQAKLSREAQQKKDNEVLDKIIEEEKKEKENAEKAKNSSNSQQSTEATETAERSQAEEQTKEYNNEPFTGEKNKSKKKAKGDWLDGEYNILFKGARAPVDVTNELKNVKNDEYSSDVKKSKEDKEKIREENKEIYIACFREINSFNEITEGINAKIAEWTEQGINYREQEKNREDLKTESTLFKFGDERKATKQENKAKKQEKFNLNEIVKILADLAKSVETINKDAESSVKLFEPKDNKAEPSLAYIVGIVKYADDLANALNSAKTSLTIVGAEDTLTDEITNTVNALHRDVLRNNGRNVLLNSGIFKLSERKRYGSSKSGKNTSFQIMSRALVRTAMNIFSALSYYNDYDWAIADEKVEDLIALVKEIDQTESTDALKIKMQEFWKNDDEWLQQKNNAGGATGQLIERLKELKKLMQNDEIDEMQESELRNDIAEWNQFSGIPRVQERNNYASTIYETKDTKYLWQYEPDKENENPCLKK